MGSVDRDDMPFDTVLMAFRRSSFEILNFTFLSPLLLVLIYIYLIIIIRQVN